MDTISVDAEIAEHIGDGSEHAEQMPGIAVSVLDDIAEAQRQNRPADYLAGLTTAYRAVMRHRFQRRHSRLAAGSELVDTWTGASLRYFPPRTDTLDTLAAVDVVCAANRLNADVFATRIDRDIAEGGL